MQLVIAVFIMRQSCLNRRISGRHIDSERFTLIIGFLQLQELEALDKGIVNQIQEY